MIEKWVETNSEGIITNFLNDERQGFTAVQVPEEWNEAFCTRTTDFKLETNDDGINILKPKSTLIIATWKKFNTTESMVDELQKKNEELQTALDTSNKALENNKTQIEQLQQMITFMSNQPANGGGTDE